MVFFFTIYSYKTKIAISSNKKAGLCPSALIFKDAVKIEFAVFILACHVFIGQNLVFQ